MQYTKPPVSIKDQIQLLEKRGLLFADKSKAEHYLSNISYYRLRAYTYPFQDINDANHAFIKSISFEDIIALYVFDRKLRFLLFDAIEKIEVAFRTKIIYSYAMNHGSHWHLDGNLFRDINRHQTQLQSLESEIQRSHETFIKHYQSTYSNPSQPPCWMTLEVTSMGLLSKIFQNLKKDPIKKQITADFGLNNIDLLENWMLCISAVRNICAHHGRLWNRRLTPIKIPTNPKNKFIGNAKIYPNKLYATIVCIQYLLEIISPGSDFKINLKKLLQSCPLLQINEIGFPNNWANDPFWR